MVYEQIKETPMGSPLSSFIAEAVLQKLEAHVFTNHRTIFWVRYVDDTFVVLMREMVAEFHALLNSIYPDIQFKMEAEVNRQMAFLYILVHRKTEDAEILGRGIDHTARETLDAWHIVPTSINRCTIFPVAYPPLRVRLNQQNRRQGVRLFAVASKRIPSQNTCLSEPLPHTNAFVGITAENANQQDLWLGVNTDAGEHSLCMNTDDGCLQPDRNEDTGNDSATTDETRTDRCKRGSRNRYTGPGQLTRAMQTRSMTLAIPTQPQARGGEKTH
ncbi:unnamed protein product [Schistocephalus solidus]|uniref:Reverse transcriptase domain-containing protein n=1 Tax=Schistocephalus solidus TaxID=70667 RepID=A0A183TNF2_SCHSO|nr:unnamed protein product [Schistocephalus solidus]